jgi:hypothetical protein
MKLLNEFRSLDYELKYVKEILREGHLEFEMYYRKWCEDNGVDLAALNKKNEKKIEASFQKTNSTQIKQMVERKEEATKKDFKSLYKAIARKLHPDTLKNDDPRKFEYSEAFKKATDAKSNGKWGQLFDVVDKYDIYLGEYDDAIECLKGDIKRVEKEIKQEKASYSWALYEAETEQQKAQVVKNFLRQLFGWREK